MTKKIRKFNIQFAHGDLAKANKVMRQWGFYKHDDGAKIEAEITTTNKASIEDYTRLLRRALEANGGELFSVEEVR